MLDQPSATRSPPDLVRQVRDVTAVLRAAAEDADATGHIASATWERLRLDGDLMLAPLPSRHSGSDLAAPERYGDLDRILRLLGGADLSFARLYEGHVNAVALVGRYGSARQVAALAAAVATGGMSAVWSADDAQGLVARREGDGWRLAGRKILASGAGFVTDPLVTARTDAGQIMILLRLARGERADAAGWTAQGMRSTATGIIDLTGLHVGADQLVGGTGDFTKQPHFSGGAWRFCAAHLGAMERLVDLLREELLAKGRQEDPYQLQRVAHCVAATTTAGFWIGTAARHLGEETAEPQAVVAFANLTRMVTERAALDVLEAVHRGVGLAAFLRPHPIERIARDLATYLRQPVPDLAMADAARTVLGSARTTGGLWRETGDP